MRKWKSPSDGHYQILLVDFGKATKVDEGKLYILNAIEKDEYSRILHQKLLKPRASRQPTVTCSQLGAFYIMSQIVSRFPPVNTKRKD